MRLITLNIWGGRIYAPLINFLKEYGPTTDIFCFQEVYRTLTNQIETRTARANIYKELVAVLPDFIGHYAASVDNEDEEGPVEYPLEFGLATFVKKDHKVEEHGDYFVYRHRHHPREVHNGSTIPRNVQYLTVTINGQTIQVYNFHGLWWYSSKDDNEHRLEQSKKIMDFITGRPSPALLCGDFNLLPETQSLAIIEQSMRNLIKEFKIPSTRSNLYAKPLRFADYIFVTPDLAVHDCHAIQRDVSDHSPLLIDCEIGTAKATSLKKESHVTT